MAIFVAFDCKTGTLNRYESGGDIPRVTHHVTILPEQLNSLTVDDLEWFRTTPHKDYAVKRLCDDPNQPQSAA